MKKIVSVLLACLLFAGCASSTFETSSAAVEPQEVSQLNILSPTGAPAIALLPVFASGQNTYTIVDGADVLQAELTGGSGAYDLIVAPTNLGVKLASAGKTEYRLLAVVDWGNLYIVGSDPDALTKEGTIAAFGEESVPGLVFKSVYTDITPEVQWVNSAKEAAPLIISGQVDAALLAEPAATAAIAQNDSLQVIDNVQEKWGDDGFPMAALFVKKSTYEENKAMLDSMLEQLEAYKDSALEDSTQLMADIESVGAETLGVPNAQIIAKCYARINVGIKKGSDCKEDIAEFLKLFGVESVDSAIIE